MKVNVIGFHGAYGSGKDTLGSALRLPDTLITKFATPLYAMAAQIDPVFHPTMTHAQKAEFVLGDENLGTRRSFLEKLGTDFGRDLIHQHFWVKLMDKRVKDYLSQHPFSHVIVTDVRAENEAAWIRANGGIVFRLHPDWIIPVPTPNAPAHKITKELEWNDSDYDVYLKHGKVNEAIDSIMYKLNTINAQIR